MRIIITGPNGKMGKLITQAASKREDMMIIAGVAPKGRPYVGLDIGIVAGLGEELNVKVVDTLEAVIEGCDLIIDYSTVEYSLEVIHTAYKHNKAVVCGTTGFSDEQMKEIKRKSKHIPILYAENTSRLVNLMYELLTKTAHVIGKEADIEIIEMHDRYKMDAPSGTSKEMGRVISKEMDKQLQDVAIFGREGAGQRVSGSIGYHSVRSGDISSSHTVMFGLLGERLEITHHAHNWECFAHGACEAAAYLFDKSAGFYSVNNILDI